MIARVTKFEEAKYVATSLRYEGEVRSGTYTLPVGKETPARGANG